MNRRAERRVLFWIVSVIFAVMLAMYATWFAISRFPIPDSNPINVGLFLFFLIVLLDLFLIGDLIKIGMREHKHISVSMSAVIFVGGFLLAAVVGLLTWGIGWLIAGRPWVPRAFYIVLGTSTILQLWWIRRKSRALSKSGANGMSER